MNVDWDKVYEVHKRIDYDSLSPNQTAKNTAQMVELLKEMKESDKRESIKTSIILIISALTLITTLVGVFR